MRTDELNNKQLLTRAEVYSLPEFKLVEASDLQVLDGGYKYLDISDDERFLLYGNEGKLILQTTNSLLPVAYP